LQIAGANDEGRTFAMIGIWSTERGFALLIEAP
jgi:hypothetical protein